MKHFSMIRGFHAADLFTIANGACGTLAVFRAMRPATVVITTPNADFNALLGVPGHRLRRPDHRFEWGRARFRCWAEGVARRNGYAVACRDLAGAHPLHGGASQMALFEREEPMAVRYVPRGAEAS